MSLEQTPAQADRAETIYEKSKPGCYAATLPKIDVPQKKGLIPENLARDESPRLPEISEPELVRHFTKLSTRNFGVDSGFYPLGSCTMKYNPKVNELAAALPGFARLHPHQDPSRAQGALELMWHLQQSLAEVAGLPHVTLQPAAGAHGELAGLLLTRAYHQDRGEDRHKVLTPDTAHGTNPATVTMAGYEVVKIATDERGGIDVEELKEKADSDVACLMLTNPNTLGVFDENIEEIAQVVHDVGGTLYYDGANLNAVMGISRPGDMGFDIVHINTHKTFSTPHGGGGPGAGPVAVSDRIEPYLPVPVVRTTESQDSSEATFYFDYDRPKSIGRLKGFYGNFGVLVRAYTYILSLGGDGLKDASETAVMNANYLLTRLHDRLDIPFDRTCMHEFVASGKTVKKELDIKVLDIAKRLLDFGIHPPTTYFPLLVDEAMMIEPTETETKERLDEFVDAIEKILDEAKEDPEIAKNAPYTTPVRRLDEVKAAKKPVIRQSFDPG